MLNTGMLWYDNNTQRTLRTKIELASAYYRDKYGHEPNICYVHPKALTAGEPEAASVKVLPASDILPHHFLLGVARERKEAGH